MAFSLTRPPSPSRDVHLTHNNVGHEEDHLSSALHAALSSFAPGSSSHSADHDMGKEKERAGIEIIVNSDCLSLKGTGVDVEPALLSGHVALHLTEATSIKEITLQFRGKVRLPAPLNDTLSLNSSPQMYSICNHEWSFLEGEKRHSHTLKAGRHLFPFQLQLGGSLPSSIATTVHGGASVTYRLRAVAVRPGLSHNMQTAIPISINRSFAPEALEYQQSLEIENTWPEKLMYSIMIPHKAWAIGDTLTAIVKFSPLAKGVRVLTVLTNINETTKLHCRGGVQEHTRSIVTVKHELVNGKAVPLIEQHHGVRAPILHGPHGSMYTSSPSVPTTPGLSAENRTLSFGSLAGLANQDLTLRQVPSAASSSSSNESHSMPPPPPPGSSSRASSSAGEPSTSTTQDDLQVGEDDVVTQLCLTVPRSATPTHTLDPITVSHRIRWSILMSNLDGHTSELRCSLPLHILDRRLLDEARSNSAATRRLLLGGPEVPPDEEHDAELPSYPAHVRDRVANMYLPDSATMRVTNPWVHNGVSPTYMNEQQSLSGSWTPSGAASPLFAHPASSHLPHVPQSGASTPLDWVNSELLLSLSNSAPSQPNVSPHSHSPAHSDPASHPASRPESRLVSRRGSRAPSPERHLAMSPISVSNETYVHSGQAGRSLPGLFSISMKPQTSLTSPGWLSSRSNSFGNLTSLTSASADWGHQRSPYSHSTGHHTPQLTPQTPPADAMPESALWHRAFTEVPNYGVASRGFIGGVPPLTSMRGLPSYEEAERSMGDTDIAARLTVPTVRRSHRSGHVSPRS
ncbi:hypothetical protein HYDPIDRAFT_32605 [Hydnomerulius pinastri MD-312]|uniref:Arrestin C-terminal-like domain-containing protein n=1 Tax=Hydnomerulius pinastri MD-312 TaxID=994086 RepID=A0A0C9W9M9_9AGAM|nr:hypothetical protein HYDPIDRAFT_32605 [Hydnomerulius pinastri MD-312]